MPRQRHRRKYKNTARCAADCFGTESNVYEGVCDRIIKVFHQHMHDYLYIGKFSGVCGEKAEHKDHL